MLRYLFVFHFLSQCLALNARKDLALQLISMETNASSTPVLRFALGSSRASDQGQSWKSSSKRRHDEGEGSNTMSAGNND
jgi:hypothetical protein